MIQALAILFSVVLASSPITSNQPLTNLENPTDSLPVLMYHNFFDDENGTVQGRDNNWMAKAQP